MSASAIFGFIYVKKLGSEQFVIMRLNIAAEIIRITQKINITQTLASFI
jgi:hypothetical protein